MRKILIKVISVITIILFLIQYNIALAESTTDMQNEQNANNQEIKDQKKELEDVKANKSKTITEIEQLDTQIVSYESEIDELDSKISNLNAKITESEGKIKEAEKEYSKQQQLLDERLITMYESGDTTYLDFILSSESLSDILSSYFLVSELASYDTDLLEKIETQRKKIETEKNKLETSKTELNTTKTSKTAKQKQLKTVKKQKNSYVAKLSEDEQKIEAKIEQLQKDNRELDRKIKAAQAAIAAAKAKQQASGVAPSSSGFIRPVNGYSITTGIYYSTGRYHGAVDFSGAGISGKPIYAVADGYVVTAQALKTSYGNYVLIAHYNGLYTLYAHGQSGSISVKAGQTVKRGQQIMKVGSTGNSTGPHLHFEVRKSPGTYSSRVNPIPYLP